MFLVEPLKYIFLTIVGITIILFYTVAALDFSIYLTHNLFNFKNTFLLCVSYLSVACLFIYLLKIFVLKKIITDEALGETLGLVIGLVMAVYSITISDIHMTEFVQNFRKTLRTILNDIKNNAKKMFPKLKR